jgi:hypothetical protein
VEDQFKEGDGRGVGPAALVARPLRTFETVGAETPASRAISASVAVPAPEVSWDADVCFFCTAEEFTVRIVTSRG